MRTTRMTPRAILAVALVFTVMAAALVAEGRAAEAKSGLYAVAYLSDGRQQEFTAIVGVARLETRWQVAGGGPWTGWVEARYPPTAAGVRELRAGIQNNITYYVVVTDGGTNWKSDKVSGDPNSTWTPYYQT